jgi:hypothetical protein
MQRKKQEMLKHIKEKKSIWKLGWIAGVSLFWLIIRTGGKPSRITYPCQRAAAANINIFLLALLGPVLALLGPVLAFGRVRTAFSHVLDHRLITPTLLVGTLLLAFVSFAFTLSSPVVQSSSIPVSINLPTHDAVGSVDPALFFVENASGSQGNLDGAISSLVNLMSAHSLYFYKTASQSSGLIGKNDVVIIKVNCQWDQDGGTNTDLVKAIIQKIVNHPEGFTGEVVIADNGQWMARTSQDAWFTVTNSYTHSQSEPNVATYFKNQGYKVSTWLWEIVRSVSVTEYSAGNYADGYVVSSTADAYTGMHLSYPKFKTTYGTYISLKNGIWTGSSYDNTRLKLMNVPVLKSHGGFGVTGSVKNYMGILSGTLTEGHGGIASGGLATVMAEAKFPTLNILDAIYVNANPVESGSASVGPGTPYTAASYTNIIGASLDPVALDYYSAKHILIPAAQAQGYNSYNSLNPDYTAKAVSTMDASFYTYLTNSMNELIRHGYSVTNSESQMNVYVRARYVNSPDINGDGKVNLQDLFILAKAYGSKPSAPNWNPKADIDGNGIVGLSDLVALVQYYGQPFP